MRAHHPRRLAVLWLVACTSSGAELARFSAMEPGAVESPWQSQSIRGRPAAAFRVVDLQGSVVEAVSDGSVASLFHPVDFAPGSKPTLSWRWRLEQIVSGSDLYKKSGDDYPARVYALFDYDLDDLTLGERWKLRLARLIYGKWVPSAALCYVPADAVPPGTTVPNPYTDRVRMIVVDRVVTGEWRGFERDVAADFAAAFGEPMPRLTGIAIAIDTDDTGERAASLFGDIVLE